MDLVTFMASLGISGGAFNKCEKIVNNGFNTIDKITQLTKEKLEDIEGFAEKSAEEFLASLETKKPLIESLLSKGLRIKKNAVKSDTAISGKKFCITGALSMKRSELQKLIKKNGGISVSSVSCNTDYLITNDTESSSSKFKKAKQLEVPIISEESFLKLLEN